MRVAVVLMAGGFSPPPIAGATGRAALDLHASVAETLLDHWLDAIESVGSAATVGGVLCACGGAAPCPAGAGDRVRVFPDESDFRGPAGALRDALNHAPGCDLVLALEAARVCRLDLERVVRSHSEQGAAVTVVAHADGSPAGVYLLRADSLDLVPHKGFMDLKEQWLGRVTERGLPTLVHRVPNNACPRVRTRSEYLRAVLPWDSCEVSGAAEAQHEPRVFDGARLTRSLVCEGAEVNPGAVCVDSVVLPGAVVEPGALVARSVVAHDTRVREGVEVVDGVFGPQGFVGDRAHETRGEARR